MSTVHDASEPRRPADSLAGVDLNLMVAFDSLAWERSVTRAAERAGVTQSAMSHSLRRLRELLGDAVLVRGRTGMVLTPRGEALVIPIRGALMTMARAIGEPAAFEPRTARRAFTLATPDLFDVLAIPPLLERIQAEASGIDVAVVSIDDRRLGEQLETGEVDVGIVPRLDERPLTQLVPAGAREASGAGILRRTLFHDRFVCLLRADHPALGSKRGRSKPLTLAAYSTMSHALVSPRGEGRGLVDAVLEQHGLARRIALRVPHFLSALSIVAKTDLVLTGPTALAHVAPAGHPVVALPPPIELPGHSLDLVWHERFSEDPGHRWFRDMVAATAATIPGKRSPRS